MDQFTHIEISAEDFYKIPSEDELLDLSWGLDNHYDNPVIIEELGDTRFDPIIID